MSSFIAAKIRVRSNDDLDALVALAARVRQVDNYPSELPGGDFVRFFNRPEPIAAWVAVSNDALIGHVALSPRTSRPAMQLVEAQSQERPAVYVTRLLVDPNARRGGVGQLLLARARRAAREAGRSVFRDVVDHAGSASAIRLYRRNGWELLGRVSIELAGDTVEELVFRAPMP